MVHWKVIQPLRNSANFEFRRCLADDPAPSDLFRYSALYKCTYFLLILFQSHNFYFLSHPIPTEAIVCYV